jgi:hypothetical protein
MTIVASMPKRRACRATAGANRDHAAGALGVGEVQQLVPGATLLEGRDELEVLELHDDRAAEDV